MTKLMTKEFEDITKIQLEVALHYLFSSSGGKLPKILESLTEDQWITIEILASQLQEERATVTLH
jgi:hypothetical protein|tara:strand:- start:2638 stop:2832 length:195 start_codon:yes stop_codon:yes gene_type:complete